MSSHDFPARYKELQGGFRRLHEESPGVTDGFFAMHRAAMADGHLPASTKELIALAIGISSRCEGCVAFHVKDALKAGATREQVVEAISVAVMMGGGPSMVFGSDALDSVEQFSAELQAVAD